MKEYASFSVPEILYSPANGWVDAAEFGASGSCVVRKGAVYRGSNRMEVEDTGDFRVGDHVTVNGGGVHYYGTLYNEKEPYFACNQKELTDEAEFSGLADGVLWRTFLIHFNKTSPVTWNWMAVEPEYQTAQQTRPVHRRYWVWQGENLPVTGEWTELADGVKIRFKKQDWKPGESLAFHARNRLIGQIAAIEPGAILLDKTFETDCDHAEILHNDQLPLQNAVDAAIERGKALLIPPGNYRLLSGLWIRNASLRVEGVDREHTVLDIRSEHTAAFWISGGEEVVIRNLKMVGHTGWMELPSSELFPTANGFAFWPTSNQQMEIKGCAAANFVGTRSLVFEDLSVTRMASEAFYSHGSDRYGNPPYIQAPHIHFPEIHTQYTQSCSFHRCRVTDCGFNAFNNNDHAENTNIINCFVERVSNFCENASRFTRIIANYAKNTAGPTCHGGAKASEWIGPTQMIFANNVFEGGSYGGGLGIGPSATQVIITGNTFIGYGKETLLYISAAGGRLPAARISVIGNTMDMTPTEGVPDNMRDAIQIDASDVIVADNHIFGRKPKSGKLTAISISPHARNLVIHDNIIENCDRAFVRGFRHYDRISDEWYYGDVESEVVEVLSEREFRAHNVPGEWPGLENAWILRWISGADAGKISPVERYEFSNGQKITLQALLNIAPGDRFVMEPAEKNRCIHHNIISNCTQSEDVE